MTKSRRPATSARTPAFAKAAAAPAAGTRLSAGGAFVLNAGSVGALLLTNASDMTWGFEVAQTEFYPPQMYLGIFLIGMPGQYLFGVTPMTMARW